jgi:sulfite exporter TauE/SafE
MYNNIIEFFIEGCLLGLASGISCGVFCLPVLIGLTARNIKTLTPVNNLLFFLLGRLISYLFIGILISFIGEKIRIINNFEIFINFFIGIILFVWGIKAFIEVDKENKNCPVRKISNTAPLIMGLITGISPCPPFIAGALKVLTIGKPLYGLIFFIGFYITTSLFLLPGLFTFLLKFKKELRVIAGFISIIFGIIYFIIAIFSFFH